MDLYQKKSRSLAQKQTIFIVEAFLVLLSYILLFRASEISWLHFLHLDEDYGDANRKLLVFVMLLVVFLRLKFTMFYLLKRHIPWEEAMSIPFAFGLYYFGFSMFTVYCEHALNAWDGIAIILFLMGSYLNSYSEIQRDRWKKKQENLDKLYTKGLFRFSIHINYFGDVLWVLGLSLLSWNIYALFIPLLLVCFFIFWNIPTLDKYLAQKYGDSFQHYASTTKKLIPYIY